MSGPLRSSIGRAKKRLADLLVKYNANVILKKDIKTLEYEDLSEFNTVLSHTIHNLETTHNDLTKHHEAWITLLSTLHDTDRSNESTIYDTFIKTYGDYQDTLGEASSSLDHLKLQKALCQIEMHNFEDEQRPATNNLNDGFHQPAHLPTTHNLLVPQVKLPPIIIPSFAGHHLEWPSFWESFQANIHNRPIEKFEKFTYLITYLKGPAKDLVEGLPCDGSSYDIAIEQLKAQYDDPATITYHLRKELIRIQADSHSNADLEKLVNAIFRIYLRLKTFNDSPDNSTNAQIIQEKFPRRIMNTVIRNLGSTSYTAKVLLDELRRVVRHEATIDRVVDTPQRSHPRESTFTTHDRVQPHRQNHHSGSRTPFPTHNRSSHFSPARSHTSNRPFVQPRSVHHSRERSYSHSHSPSHTQRPHTPQPHISCQFCTGPHPSSTCTTYRTTSDRKKQVQHLKLCFNCLGSDHLLPECKSRFSCKICRQRHHSLLCYKHPQGQANHSFPHVRFAPQQQPTAGIRPRTSTPTRRPHSTHSVVAHPDDLITHPAEHSFTTTCESNPPAPELSEEVLLMCTEVTLYNPDDPEKQHHVLAFLDSGSTRSYITSALADDLNLVTHQIEDLTINTFGTTDTKSLPTKRHSLGLQTDDHSFTMNVTSVQQLTGKMRTLKLNQKDATALTNSVPRSLTTSAQPSLLIGNDYMWDFIEDTDISTLPSGFKIIKSKIGNIITGKGKITPNPSTLLSITSTNPICDSSLQPSASDIRTALERLWSLESVGISDDPITSDDAICLKMTMDTIQRSGTRYRVKWPWKSTTPNLASNFHLCKARLKGVYNQLKAKPDLLKQYHAIFTEQLDLDIIEEVSPNQLDGPYTHYLPHHAVVTPQKTTTKVRIVYDASAKQKGYSSLNECLYRGPVLIPNLCGVLLRCRLYPIILIADIQKAFLQVELDIPDREVTRFLWLKDISKGLTPENTTIYRFQRVPFGVISSPFLLGATIHHHLQLTDTPISAAILRNLYVDNVLLCADNATDAQSLYKDARQVFATAGMNFRDWVSNDSSFNTFMKHAGESPPDHLKILGIHWNIPSDTFTLSTKSMTLVENEPLTKRMILQYVNSLFDPLGWLSPIMILPKLFLQTLWKQKLGWDDDIGSELREQWISVQQPTDTLTFTMDRILSSTNSNVIYELHIFTDASGKAHGATAYLRTRTPTTNTCNLIFSKSRLSPIEKMTIPRLELTALQIGVKMSLFLHKELDIPIAKTCIWTDSKCSLEWLLKDDLTVYVKNRVTQILKAPTHTTFLHVDTKHNPADIISRGCTAEELTSNALWWHGPHFLQTTKDTDPTEFKLAISLADILQQKDKSSSTTLLAQEQSDPPVISYQRFSCLTKLIHTVAFLLYFIRRCTTHVFSAHFQSTLQSDNLRNNTNASLTFLIRLAQTESPPDKLQIQNLKLEKDANGIWRSSGRISNSDLPYDTKFPIYLPREHPLTHLIIMDVHKSLQHAGVNQVLSQLRQRFWITKGRSTVKSTIRRMCYHCRRTQSQPYRLPPFPDLPGTRTIPSRPFENIGIDYMGPFNTHTPTGSAKAWVCIFVCMFTRAIHCETIYTLSAEGFLHAFRRYISRRGKPRLINSDNGTQFKLAASTIRTYEQIFSDPCQPESIIWTFNTEHAPWQGGHFERLIGTFKSSLRHAMGRSTMSSICFETQIGEAEAIVNSRPLTYIPDDLSFTPLRPVDFLISRACITCYDFKIDPYDDKDEAYDPDPTPQSRLFTLWTKAQRLTQYFMSEWKDQYLLLLRERYTLHHKQGKSLSHLSPVPGDIVLIEDESLPKTHWRLGRIETISNAPIRSATVRTSKTSTLNRPINHLYPLEIPQSPHQPTLPIPSKPPSQGGEQQPRRSARLRLKTKVFFILSLLSFVQSSLGSLPAECPPNLIGATKIYSPSCSLTGESIFQHNSEYCWKPYECPSSKPHSLYCDFNCTCPSWATSCSSYNGVYVQWTHDNGFIINKTITEHQLSVCSWTASPNCHSEPVTAICNKIQLLDDSIYLVTSLTLRSTDFVHLDPPICHGEAPIPMGTQSYCLANECISKSPRFCYYAQPPLQFLVGKTHNIPLRAYGYHPCFYYPHTQSVPTILSYCTDCSFICTHYGLEIKASPPPSHIEYCMASECTLLNTDHTPLKDNLLPIPEEYSLFDYQITIRMWRYGTLLYSGTKTCPHIQLCELIHCRFCKDFIFNIKECITTTDLVTYVPIILLIGLPILSIIKHLLQILRLGISFIPGLTCISNILKAIWNILTYPCKRCKRNTPHTISAPIQRRIRQMRRKTTTTLLTLCLTWNIASACDTVAYLGNNNTICSLNSLNQHSCQTTASHIFTIPSTTSTVCLEIPSSDGRTILGQLRFKFQPLRYTCNIKTQYYTRDHSFTTHSSKRCHHGGDSCKGTICQDMKVTDSINDFSSAVNNAPGFSYCAESCGCITCGCFLCSAGCLFYRTIAIPTSNTIYKIFTCPTFTTHLSLQLEFVINNNTRLYSATLSPGMRTFITQDIYATLLSNSIATAPILSSSFLQNLDDHHIIITSTAPRAQPLPGTVGQLQCSSHLHASKFDCTFSPNTCICRTAETTANCNCQTVDLSHLFSDEEHLLPLQTETLHLHPHPIHTITATYHSSANFQLQLDLNHLHTQYFKYDNTCNSTISRFTGCHSCKTGARAQVSCTTNFGNTLARLSCEHHNFAIQCSTTPSPTTITIHHDLSSIDMTCSMTCPANVQHIKIQGYLLTLNSTSFISMQHNLISAYQVTSTNLSQ